MEELLKQIVREFNKGPMFTGYHNPTTEGQKLWAVLSALRGPDISHLGDKVDVSIKEATTSVIRWKIGVNKNNAGGAIVKPDSEWALGIRQWLEKEYSHHHFVIHAKWAFSALGLKWDELNQPVS